MQRDWVCHLELLQQAGEWNDFNRNWTLAKACIKRAAEKGMKSILIGKQADAGKEVG